MFNLGVIVNQAVNNPDGLKKLDPSRQQVVGKDGFVDPDTVPAMLRPVKKKKAKIDGK